MKPILRWQYEQITKCLLLIQGHGANIECPCSSEGEACLRKHYLELEALCEETSPICDDEEMKQKLFDLTKEARNLRADEELKLCDKEGHLDTDIADWARNWRKQFEQACLVCDLAPAEEALVKEVSRMFEETCERPSTKYQYLSTFFTESASEAALFATETERIERKIDTVLAQLESGIAEIHESSKFKDFIDTMSKFHDYSLGNIILITLQRPAATNVAGYRTWQDLGRNVKKSEHGIMILAPCFPPKPKKEEEDEEEIEPELRPIYFKVVHVFDVAQTEGKELPKIEVPTITGKETGPLFQDAATFVAKQGITLDSRPRPDLDPDLMGFWSKPNNLIWVRPEAPQDQKTKTLLHETAHSMCERRGARDAEVMAESVAYTVANHFGFDTGVRSFPYVALWAGDVKVLKSNLEIIRKVAGDMIGGIEQIAELSTGTMEVVKMFETVCPCKIGIEPEEMSVQAIQDEMNALLFDEETQKACDAKDRELLSIIIAQPKAFHFDFLTGKTEWKVHGKWKRPEDGFDIEPNIQLDIEFKDAPDECVGKRIIELLKAYNKKVVGEILLYARTIPIEEGTLEVATRMVEKTRDGKLRAIERIVDMEIWLGKLALGTTMDRAKTLAKLKVEELDSLYRDLITVKFDWDRIVAQSIYIGMGRKVPAYLEKGAELAQGTLGAIGSAAVTGLGIGLGLQVAEKLIKTFSKKEEKEGEMAKGTEIRTHFMEVAKERVENALAQLDKVVKVGWEEKLSREEQEILDELVSVWTRLTDDMRAIYDVMGIKLREEAPYARQLPAYVDVFKTTIAKHYRPTEDFHEGSIRVVKPEQDILVYLGCLKSDNWDAEAERCSPNPTVLKTIVPNTKKYLDELEHLKLVHPEIKVNYREKEVGVEPVVSEAEQKELEAVGEALGKAEAV